MATGLVEGKNEFNLVQLGIKIWPADVEELDKYV